MSWRQDKPILGVVGFNLFTLLVFVTAPVRWNTDNLAEVCVFVLTCQLLVLFGFRLGRGTRHATPARRLPFFDGRTLVTCLFAVYLLTFPLSYAYKMEFAPFDLGGMLSRLLAGLQDPHSAYAATQEKTGGGPIPWSAYFVVSVFNQSFFAAGFLFWRQLSRARKLVFLGFLGIELFYWLGIATSFGVMSLATTFGLSAMFWQAPVRRWSTRRLVASAVLGCLLLAASIGYFSYNLYRRSNFQQIDVEQYEIARSPVIVDHPVLALVPQALRPTYVMAASYFAQGYYHMCFAFDLDFRSTALLGNNPAIIAIASAFGVDVWPDTYMHRLHGKGIDEYGVWHTAYTWFACDVSFYGVPVLLFFLGYCFGLSWAEGGRGDFLSRLVFIMFGNILLFLFANNTYLSSVFCTFVVAVPLWMLTRVGGAIRYSAIGRRPTRVAAVGASASGRAS